MEGIIRERFAVKKSVEGIIREEKSIIRDAVEFSFYYPRSAPNLMWLTNSIYGQYVNLY